MIESDSTDTKPVRASEQLDWAALDAFAREQLSTVLGAQFDATAPMTVEQFPGGHSNLTYLLRFGAQEFVMRRPPFGPVPPGARCRRCDGGRARKPASGAHQPVRTRRARQPRRSRRATRTRVD